MRVVIDAHMVGHHETGNETYVVNLLAGLAPLLGESLAAAADPASVWSPALAQTGLACLPLTPSGDWRRLLYTLAGACRDWRADILHVTYIAPLRVPARLVVSVHDISFKRQPEFFSPRDRLLFATLLPFTLRRARAVLTISEHARREICQVFPYVADRVYAIPLAPAATYRPLRDPAYLAALRRRYALNQPFWLTVGNMQPRKNLRRVVRALAVTPEAWRRPLVIVGQAHWQASEVYAEVERLGLHNWVVFTGYVPDDDLVGLYNAAEAFIYASLYEGFGLPILEAMACGTPVICSNVASMPEVAGDAALLIDPVDETAIAAAWQRLVTEKDLADELSQRGLAQAARFSWVQTAAATFDVYARVM